MASDDVVEVDVACDWHMRWTYLTMTHVVYVGQCYGAMWPRHGLPCGTPPWCKILLDSIGFEPMTFGCGKATWQGRATSLRALCFLTHNL
jgi:hypothetical protein